MRAIEPVFGTAIVVLSVALNLVHTISHFGQQVVTLPAWQLAYIGVVIYAAPVVAATLLQTRRRLAGAWLLAASMAGSFVFGLVYHFLVPGPDNVFTLHHGAWVTAFQVSAVLLAVLQLAGFLIGVWAAMRLSSPPPPDSLIRREVRRGITDEAGWFCLCVRERHRSPRNRGHRGAG